MRTILCLISLGFLLIPIGAEDAPPPEWKTNLKDVAIPMRDGKSLAGDVYLPKTAGKYPAILVQTPYDKKRMGAVTTDSGEAGRGSQTAWNMFDFDHYVYVIVDWRGFYASKAAMEGVRRPKRGEDGYDCVEWVAKQEWCNGKVGTWGGSALGKQQLDTAAEQPPHLVCAAPLIAAMGQCYEAYYEGGVALEAHIKTLDKLGFGVSTAVNAAPLPDTLVWKTAKRNTYAPEKINVPCLMVSGWWDNYPDLVLETFNDICAKGGEAARKGSKLVMGPWSHTQIDLAKQGDLEFKAAENYSTKITLKFFDFWLRDIKEGWDKVPRIHAFTGTEWLTAEKWDDFKPTKREMFLDYQHFIRNERPDYDPTPSEGVVDDQTRRYTYNPKDAPQTFGGANLPPLTYGPKDNAALEKRKDVLVYSTGKLEKPLVLFGNAELEFTFSVDRVDCDFSVRLCDGDGKADYLVAEGIQRAKLRNGKVELLKPGEKTRLKVTLNLASYTFAKDHELKILLSSGNSPRYERNCHTGDNHWDESKALELGVTIYHDGDDAAVLRLPVK